MEKTKDERSEVRRRGGNEEAEAANAAGADLADLVAKADLMRPHAEWSVYTAERARDAASGAIKEFLCISR